MIIYFADRFLNILGQANTSLPLGYTISEDKKTDDVESGTSVFECDISYDRSTRAQLMEWAECGNYILRHNGEDQEFYTIIDVEISTKKQKAYIYAEDNGMDLINEVVGQYTADQPYHIIHYVEMYVSGSGWEIGINEVEGLTRQLSWDGDQTVLERLAEIAAAFDSCELSYSFDISGLQVTKKFINIHAERGKDTGLQLRLNKEIDSIITTKTISNLATALRPIGSDAITLLGYEYDDGDFYVDGELLKSRKALEKWGRFLYAGSNAQEGGHIVKSYSDDSTSKAFLCENAVAELKKLCNMEVNYQIDITDLSDDVRIGDRVNIIDDDGELYLSSRVLKLEESVCEDSRVATLGEHLIRDSGISQKVADLAANFAIQAAALAQALAEAAAAERAAAEAEEQAAAAQGSSNANQSAIGQAELVIQKLSNSISHLVSDSMRYYKVDYDEATGTYTRTDEVLEASAGEVVEEAVTTDGEQVYSGTLEDGTSAFYVISSGQSLMTKNSDGEWTFSTEALQQAINATVEGLEKLEQQVGSAEADLQILKQVTDEHFAYINIGTWKDPAGVERAALELGESSSTQKLLVTSVAIIFSVDGNQETYIDKDGLKTDNITVENEIRQGGFVQMNTSDGGWGLLWKGVVE